MKDNVLRSFDQSLPMALMRAREATMRRFRPILASHDLTEQQWRVLRALNQTDDPLDVGDLADMTFLLGPSLSRILSNLDTRGHIRRRTAPNDQRRSIISLTAKGRRLVARIAPASEAQYAELETMIGNSDLTQLFELLEKLTNTAPESTGAADTTTAIDDQSALEESA